MKERSYPLINTHVLLCKLERKTVLRRSRYLVEYLSKPNEPKPIKLNQTKPNLSTPEQYNGTKPNQTLKNSTLI